VKHPDDLDVISRQVLRYYSEDDFAFAAWCEARSNSPEKSLKWLDRGLGFGLHQTQGFANAAYQLGRMGYPEAAADLCREGLRYDGHGVSLNQNLSQALREAAREYSPGKPVKYRSLAEKAGRDGWVFLAPRLSATADRLKGVERGTP
jgi:hypothetical protein